MNGLKEARGWRSPRKLIVREESETSWDHGFNPRSRPIELLLRSAVVVLDKQGGPTSHDVVATFKRLADLSKVGHTGTLAIASGKSQSDRRSDPADRWRDQHHVVHAHVQKGVRRGS